MNLTIEKIENILNNAPQGFEHYDIDFEVYTKVLNEKLCVFLDGIWCKSRHSSPMHYLSRETSRFHKRELELMLRIMKLEHQTKQMYVEVS